ncbi:MAG: fibronectin type III domain-containing protein, partial [Bacteroidetes bacterium]
MDLNMYTLNFKRLFILLIFTGCFHAGIGQSINNYVFSTSNTASINRSAGSIVDDISLTSGFEVQVGGSLNNQTGALDTIPFDFWFNGVRINRFNATSNGWVGLSNTAQTFSGATFGGTAFSSRLTPFLTATGNNGMGTSQNGKVQTKVFGSQPNRVFVIEYLNMAINFNGTSSDSNTFQVRLYENNGAIEYVYGRMANLLALGMNYNVGFQFTGTNIFQHVNTSTNTASTSVSTANVAPVGDILPLVGRTPGSQRSYTWTPTPVSDPGFITVSNITTTSMDLSWTDVSNETAYAIYRSTDGGATYTFQAQLFPNTTTFAATNLIANTTYDWRVYAVRESISAPSDGQGTTLPASKFFTTSGGNWNDPLIWNTLAVPSAQDSAEISTGHIVTLDATPISCGTLIVNGTLNYWNSTVQQVFTVNGDVIVNPSGTFTAGIGTGNATLPHVLNIGGNTTASTLPGNLIVNGTFDMLTTASVQTVFFGTSNGTITGTGPTCEMPFISVTKGGVAPFVVDNTLEILRVITQPNATSTYTATQRLVATSGTLKISAPLVFNSLHTTTVTLASAFGARFWLNNASANIGVVPAFVTNQTLNLTGELRIDAGTLSIGTGGIFAAGNMNFQSVMRLNGGVLNILGGLLVNSSPTCQLIVAGGRLTLDPQAANNLSQFINILNIQANSTFTMTSGSIEILDPHSGGGGTAITIAAGGVKSVTGGTFIIGNTLAAPSGGAFATNSGFGLNIAIPIHHLTLSNNISVNTSRQCRLLADLTVNGNLTLDADAFIITGAVPTGRALNVLGNIVNNGVISGTSPGLTAPPGIGSLNLIGTTAQGISGSGTTNLLTLRVANASGANFTNTGTWALENVTLETGNVTNTGTNIQIGAATYRGRITIGGLNETTASGSFSTLPSIITTFGNPSYVYGPSATALQTGSANEMPSGAQTLFNLTINDAQGVVSNRNITVTGTLALTAGNLNMGTNNITVGLSAVAPGTLSRTNGFVQLATNGSFTRWYNTSILPAFDYASGFPLSTVSSERSVLFSLNGGSFTTGGNLTVRHTNIVGFTDVPSFLDGSTTINRRTNSFWTISSSPGFTPVISTTLSLRLIGAGIGAVSDVTQLKVTKATAVAGGTTQSGSGTNSRPEANRDFSNANLSGGAMFDDFHIGTNSGINPLSPTIIAIQTGNWNETATWEGGIIPDITNSATIATGVNVTIPTGVTAACNGLSINAGGTLTGTSGTLNSAS